MRVVLDGFRLRVALSVLMVVGEAAGGVALPFMLGLAIDDYLAASYRGLLILGTVAVATVFLVTIRRFHDARLYARIYERASGATIDHDAALSAKTARLNMLREVMDFLEYSLPGLVASVAGFIGTLIFLAVLSLPVFIGAVVMAGLIVLVYALTTGRTVALNRSYNDEYERQVDVLRRNDRELAVRHVALLDRWVIKLADLDTSNTAVALILIIGLQIFTIITSASHGFDAGELLSIVLYVFEFSATAAMLPTSWQEYLRLRDILQRLRTTG